jgi:hypothetical protein
VEVDGRANAVDGADGTRRNAARRARHWDGAGAIAATTRVRRAAGERDGFAAGTASAVKSGADDEWRLGILHCHREAALCIADTGFADLANDRSRTVPSKSKMSLAVLLCSRNQPNKANQIYNKYNGTSRSLSLCPSKN